MLIGSSRELSLAVEFNKCGLKFLWGFIYLLDSAIFTRISFGTLIVITGRREKGC